MERVPVESSHLATVGYEIETSTLEIEFKKSGIYQYFGVPQEIYEGLMAAGSKGQYFDQQIKKAGYPYTKIG
jgi:hypothetical protein